MRRYLITAVALSIGVPLGATTYVQPGQQGVTLTVEIDNASDSGADIASAQEVVSNADVVMQNIQVSPASAIPIGQTQTYTVTFDIASNIPSTPTPYKFSVTLNDIINDAVDPSPAAQTTVVNFVIQATPPQTTITVGGNGGDVYTAERFSGALRW